MGGYQPAEEVALWKARDPILLSRAALAEALGTATVEAVEAAADEEVEAAFEAALADALPVFAPHPASAPYLEA